MEELTKDELVLMVSVLVSDISMYENELEKLNEMSKRGGGTEFHQSHISDVENRITRRNQLLSKIIKLLAEEDERWPPRT